LQEEVYFVGLNLGWFCNCAVVP